VSGYVVIDETIVLRAEDVARLLEIASGWGTHPLADHLEES